MLTASAQDQVSQKVYVYEGDFNGTMLSDVQVTGQDAVGNSFEGITDSNGVVVIDGQPGTWQFIFMKDGYSPLELNYNVTETGDGAVYLQRATQIQDQVPLTQDQVSQTQDQVTQTVYVHEGNLNGTMLSDVQVTGQDAAGNSFERITDSNGVVVISGQPGTWQFAFMKDGYNPLELNYDVIETGEGAVYLQKAT
jgi:flagellar hook assembly protein FlgD